MKPDKPKPEPIPLFVKRMRAIAQSIEMMERPELLGNIDAIRPELAEVRNQVTALVAYADQHEADCKTIDDQLQAATPGTNEPLLQKRQNIADAAAMHYQRQAARLAQSLRLISELLLAEYHIELQKLAGTITTSQDADLARTKLKKAIAQTDDMTPLKGKRKPTPLQKQLAMWEDLFSIDGLLGVYKIFSPDKEVLERASDIPDEYRAAAILMNANYVLDMTADHAMQAFEAIRDMQRSSKKGK